MANVLITGASKGIGSATALAFARAGHTVAAAMRRPDRAPELAAAAATESLPVTVFTMDVDDDASVSQGVAKVAATLGPIDVLVNNAGLERLGAVEDVAMADFRAAMETNYFGAIRTIQAVLPSMRERRTGCIVNVSSISGRLATSPFAPYAASKFALEALSECLAQEVKAFGIRVRIIEPGIIDTSMARRVGEAGPAASRYPQERRNGALFAAALQRPTPASLVADTIVHAATSDTEQLRHLAGPDAGPFLGWRQSMTDEEWITFGGSDDATWLARVKADFGMDLTLPE